jgi:hypothetical protein
MIMIRVQSLCILLVLVISVHAQKTVPGRVLIAGTTNPVSSANVYLSSTSIGTVSDDKGNFTFQRFPEGRYDLIVSCIGYETYQLSIRSDELPPQLTIFLKPQVSELQEVVLEPYDKDGWQQWGDVFIDNFIGTSEFAQDCRLINKNVLKLRLGKKTNILKVSATGQLLIENNALGYILKYDLTRFEFNLTTREFLYQGYPFFAEMVTTKKGLQKRWIENRETAYYGSLMHFMRSISQNTIKEDKFEVRQWIEVLPEEKKRIKEIYPQLSKKVTGIHPDSLAYYQSVMKQMDSSRILINVLLSKKDITHAIDNTTTGLQFSEISVVYLPKINPLAYTKYLPKNRMYEPVESSVSQAPGTMVSVLGNGSFFEGINLITAGYWSWWEKMCNKLPYDYQPPVKDISK